MGNPMTKLAKCDAPANLPPLPPPGVAPTPPEEVKPELVQQAEKAMKGDVTCPGLYDNATGEIKRLIALDVYDGMRFELTKSLNQQFAVNHNFWLGTSLIPGGTHYTYGVNVVPTQETFLLGRLDAMGRLDARVHHRINERTTTKMQAMLSSDVEQSQLGVEGEYAGDTWSGQAKIMGGVVSASYLQAVTPTLALGGEAVYVPERSMSVLSYVGKYSNKEISAVASYARGNAQFHYLRKLSDRVSLGAELTTDWPQRESTVALGAEFDLRQSKFNTCVDGSGKISSLLEFKIQPGVSLTLTADVSHAASSYKFGYGVSLG